MRNNLILSAAFALPMALAAAPARAQEPAQEPTNVTRPSETATASEFAPKPPGYHELWRDAQAAAESKDYKRAVDLTRAAIFAYEDVYKAVNPNAPAPSQSKFTTAFDKKNPFNELHMLVVKGIRELHEQVETNIKAIETRDRENRKGTSQSIETFNIMSIADKNAKTKELLERINYLLGADMEGHSLEIRSQTLGQAGVDANLYYDAYVPRFGARVTKPLTTAALSTQKPAPQQ